MDKMHVSLDVTDLDAAVEFYRRFFAAEPAKRRPGYANFDLQDPPLKLALNAADRNGLSHLGVQVEGTERVLAAMERFKADGLPTVAEMDANCCHALQDKVWVQDPAGHAWEVFVVKADATASQAVAGNPLTPVRTNLAGCCSGAADG